MDETSLAVSRSFDQAMRFNLEVAYNFTQNAWRILMNPAGIRYYVVLQNDRSGSCTTEQAGRYPRVLLYLSDSDAHLYVTTFPPPFQSPLKPQKFLGYIWASRCIVLVKGRKKKNTMQSSMEILAASLSFCATCATGLESGLPARSRFLHNHVSFAAVWPEYCGRGTGGDVTCSCSRLARDSLCCVTRADIERVSRCVT